jgi:hypothetical protein
VVDELLVDDRFQPEGVLVRLEDNTLGHVKWVQGVPISGREFSYEIA